MFVLGALAIWLVIGFFGGTSRTRRYGWMGAAIAVIALVLVVVSYHYHAQKLPELIEKRDDLLTRLRTNRICLDMETHPKHWQKTKLEYPCIGYSGDQLRAQIAGQEDVLEDWNRAIRDRQALLRARENGQF